MLNIYLEEANELLDKLESTLLSLNESTNHRPHIEEIFRIMHTLKGNSSMFGLDKVAAFIHNLESLHD
jgi:two-component system chemotaxis sensor kinase CheA